MVYVQARVASGTAKTASVATSEVEAPFRRILGV